VTNQQKMYSFFLKWSAGIFVCRLKEAHIEHNKAIWKSDDSIVKKNVVFLKYFWKIDK